MPRFTRTNPAPTVSGGYAAYRLHVQGDFESVCAYCLLNELFAAGEENFELDHFKPRSLFPESVTDFYNLYWSCHVCNRIKHNKWPCAALQSKGIGIVDLCIEDVERQFRELPDGKWEGITPSAQYTIDALRLNRQHLVKVRRLIQQIFLPTEQGEQS
jgi:uncharacterized protein (TIGR02646 family)